MTKTKIKSNSFGELVGKIDIRPYVDSIQTTIKDISVAIGLERTDQEIRRARLVLQLKLEELAEHLTQEMGFRGDPNISFMLSESLICCAWSTFIIQAKSLDYQRPREHRKAMKEILKGLEEAYQKILSNAMDYGKSYDKVIF